MTILNKPLGDLTEVDFQGLVENGVAERKTTEYKSVLPGESDSAKKEFLADVSSFANSSGGHLIYGIEAKDGVAIQARGLDLANVDEAMLRLDSMMRSGIQPRMPFESSHYMHPVELQSGRTIIVMRVPRSWNAPHMVTFKNSSRFFARASNGKYQLDVGEIRSAFLRSETFANLARAFRVDRLSRVVAGETPLLLPNTPKLILHIVPFGAFDAGIRFDLSAPEQRTPVMASVHPVGAVTTDTRPNFDGLLHRGNNSYVQMFRNGCIESVNASILSQSNGSKAIPSIEYEHRLIVALRSYLAFQRQLGIEPPLVVMLSIVGVLGYVMAVQNPIYMRLGQDHPIDRDILVVPEELVQGYDCDVEQVLKPCFDTVWNAAGWPRSQNYDDAGRWMSPYR